MALPAARRRTRSTRLTARRAARSRAMAGLARAGLLARGVLYLIVGWLALQIAFGSTGQRAESSGALRVVAQTAVGTFVLWLLAIGFAGLALWRLSEAIWGSPGQGRKATVRLAALGRAVIYGVFSFTILKYALGLGAPASSNSQSRDLTAAALRQPGGQILVTLIGLAVIAAGLAIAWQAWRKTFLRRLRLSGVSRVTRRVVTRLGQAGGMARGIVFAAAGVFLVVAAVHAQPSQARGIDATLRALAATPLGPLVLVVVAAGLVLFGAYSCCEARWRAV